MINYKFKLITWGRKLRFHKNQHFTIYLNLQNGNSHRCDFFDFYIHRAPYARILKTRKRFDSDKIIPTNFPIESNESNITKQKLRNQKILREIAGENFKTVDKQLN